MFKLIYYILFIAVIGYNLHDLHYFDMVEAHGKLKIIKAIPAEFLGTISLCSFLILLFSTYSKIDRLTSKNPHNGWWWATILMTLIEGVAEVVQTGRPDNETLDLVCFLILCIYIVTIGILGYKLKGSYQGRIRGLGNTFLYVPGIAMILGIALFACLPDSYGDIETTIRETGFGIYEEYSYSTSTVVWTLIIAFIGASSYLFIGSACLSVLNSSDEFLLENSFIIPYSSESLEHVSEVSSPETENVSLSSSLSPSLNVNEPGNGSNVVNIHSSGISIPIEGQEEYEYGEVDDTKRKKKWLITGGIVLFLGLGALIGKFIYTSNNPLTELMSEVNPPKIDPGNLGYISDLRLTGWSAFEEEWEDIKLKIAHEISVRLDFQRGEEDKDKGIPVKVSILNNSANGADEITGFGYLKNGELRIYQRSDEDFAAFEREGWLMLEADNIDNLADFQATVYLYPEDEGEKYNLIDRLTWLKAIQASLTSVYETEDGSSSVHLQLIKPFGKNVTGVKALVFCADMMAYEEEYEDTVSGSWILTLIDSNDYMLLVSDPMPYLGVAKWEKDKLIVTKDGEKYEMVLKERYECQNAEIDESIMEMEGWD